MKSEKAISTKWPTIVTLIAFAVVFYTQVIWAIVASNSHSQEEAVYAFLSHFPSFLNNVALVTYTTLISCIIAVVFTSIWMRRTKYKALPIVILVLSSLITLLTVFQLM